MVSPELIMPGRFYPLSGTKVDDRGCKLAGYIEYGGVNDPVVRGSLVMIVGAEAEYRVMVVRGNCYDLLRNSRDTPTRLYLVAASNIRRHLRERRRVNHPDGGASIITRFGEPGLVGGPGHQLVLRKCGVTWFTARELWRLQHGDVAEADARFDAFVKLHPSASYEDLAGVAGDAIASVWADAAAFRSSSRCAMVTVAAMKRIAKWAEAQLLARRDGPSRHNHDP